MKINLIIKNKRIEQNLTQEQLASSLGVSTPAVNKWEKGVSYPDITLLSPLARLLKVDLNTLLSFNEELTDREINEFINNVVMSIQTDGYESVFQKCMDKIREYPTCDKLILNLAITLLGSLYMYNITDKDVYEEKIIQLYEQCANSEKVEIRNQAISLLINRYIEQKDYEHAQKYIDILPTISYDKIQLQGNLYRSKGELNKASEIFEGKLLKSMTEIFSTLITMIEIALQESRIDDAENIAEIIEKTNILYELWNYNSYAAYFQLYTTQKDQEKLIELLEKMIPALKNEWDISKTRLYRHIKKKDINEQEHKQFVQIFLEMLKNDVDESLSFVKENPRFVEILNRYN
ncbi:helix-turn-helix domain-containing protein [uncultured Clostridium sp.]|uniref:helix-turn-helix domain-containing protein n=1 Tax=uncultured Clostridium sp. TaxID=59620 RepID=UPI0025D7DC3D|nr:helix-turn-helix transcriptional regulator [uncultured Clostridium sp.]MDU4883218.1 helix-turn-helix transcriptional regulator [Clostridium celatum]MDU7076948.1 helix-turn-helix transcriptional regulator [Clostridium celatum]